MPNWCDCTLSVYGVEDLRHDFMQVARGEEALDYNKFVPYPKEYEDADRMSEEAANRGVRGDQRPKDGYNNGGHRWCIENWGVKWNASCVEIHERPRSILYTFQAPWGPPIPVILAMAELYPYLRFMLKYNEPGCELSGTVVCKDGIVKEYSGNKE
jgi:hypothetical protein